MNGIEANSGLIKESWGGILVSPIIADNQNMLYVGSSSPSSKGAYRSLNDGKNWEHLGVGLPEKLVVTSFALKNDSCLFMGTEQGVFKTIDGGLSWQLITPVLINSAFVFCLVIDNAGVLFIGTEGSGRVGTPTEYGKVYYSPDDGNSWNEISSGLEKLHIWSLAINSQGQLFAGTGYHGIFRGTPVLNTSVSEKKGNLSSFVLLQNYPNPFNPETSIRYYLPQAINVTMTIYNMRGQIVRQLINSQQLAGHHSIIWNGRDDAGDFVSSGLYFYKMQAGRFTQTKKLTLLR